MPSALAATGSPGGRRLAAVEGRDPASLARLVLVGHRERPLASVDAFHDVAGRYEDAGFSDLVVHWPRPDEPFGADMAVLERVAAEVPVASDPGVGILDRE
jgi:hypothetical protein